jgi:hypothetical protein
MIIGNWETIALIITSFIAQLIAPALAELVKSRINQPKPTPLQNQPKNRSQRIGTWVIRVVQSPWPIPVSTITFNIYMLSRILREATPITRWVVLSIAVGVSVIFYSLLNISVLLNSQIISINFQTIQSQAELTGKIADVVVGIRDRMLAKDNH